MRGDQRELPHTMAPYTAILYTQEGTSRMPSWYLLVTPVLSQQKIPPLFPLSDIYISYSISLIYVIYFVHLFVYDSGGDHSVPFGRLARTLYGKQREFFEKFFVRLFGWLFVRLFGRLFVYLLYQKKLRLEKFELCALDT